MKVDLSIREVYPIYGIDDAHSINDIDVPNKTLENWIKVLKEFEKIQLEIASFLNVNEVTKLTYLDLKDIK